MRLPGTRCPQTGYESGDPSRPGLITTLSQAGSSLLLHPRPGRSPPDVAVDRDRGEQKMARSCGIHDRAATGERWFHPSRLAWWCAELSPIGSPVTARPCHATITGRGGCCSSPLTWCCVVCDLVTVFSVWPPLHPRQERHSKLSRTFLSHFLRYPSQLPTIRGRQLQPVHEILSDGWRWFHPSRSGAQDVVLNQALRKLLRRYIWYVARSICNMRSASGTDRPEPGRFEIRNRPKLAQKKKKTSLICILDLYLSQQGRSGG